MYTGMHDMHIILYAQSGSRALGSMAPICSDQQAGLLSAEVKALTKFVTNFLIATMTQ